MKDRLRWRDRKVSTSQLRDYCIIKARNDKILSQSNVSGNGQTHFVRTVTDWMCGVNKTCLGSLLKFWLREKDDSIEHVVFSSWMN